MYSSVITFKGQTTIPKEIRKYLKLKPQAKIVYVPDGGRVYLSPIEGTILDLKGMVKQAHQKPIDFHKLRDQLKQKVAQEADREGK